MESRVGFESRGSNETPVLGEVKQAANVAGKLSPED